MEVPTTRTAILPQMETDAQLLEGMAGQYRSYEDQSAGASLPEDRAAFIASTIDYGIAAAQMQLDWCRRTRRLLETLANHG